jgi:flagellar hook-basal body complex protein FliE
MISSINPLQSSVVSGLAQNAVSPASATGTPEVDFSKLMSSMATSTVSALRESEAAAIGAVSGQTSAQDAVTKIMEAERKLQQAVAVRDKVISTYTELTRMQI